MTYLDLVAEVGTVPMDMARMYFNGGLTEKELKNVIGRKKAGLVERFRAQKDCEMSIENNSPLCYSK